MKDSEKEDKTMNRTMKLKIKSAIFFAFGLVALTISCQTFANGQNGPFVAVPLYRFFQSDGTDHFHFYTADKDEMTALKHSPGWKYEGPIGYVFPVKAHPPKTSPLYRLAKVEFGEANHFYTMDKAEADKAINGGWTSEGICCYLSPTQVAGTIPLIRLYKTCIVPSDGGEFVQNTMGCGGATGGDSHFYTTNGEEKFKVIDQAGFQFIRNEGYLWPQPTTIAGPPQQKKVDYDGVLLDLGCTRNAPGDYQCETQRSYETCDSLKKQGLAKACSTHVNLKIQDSIDKELFSVGCTRFLGRADEFVCKTQNALNVCEAYRKNGKVKKCTLETK